MQAQRPERIVAIENEVGDVNINGELIMDALDTVKLTAGCTWCSLNEDLYDGTPCTPYEPPTKISCCVNKRHRPNLIFHCYNLNKMQKTARLVQTAPFKNQMTRPLDPMDIRLQSEKARTETEQLHWQRIAWWLALATIFYNLAEGLFCTIFGLQDESFTLFGFGLDSFIECISGLGIAHMVWRMRREGVARRDDFERLALRITGWAFYALAALLAATAGWSVWSGQKPETTFWGVVVAAVSLSVMWAMIWQKEKAGRALQSEAILADAQCARVCMWMSIILLVSSGLYAWFSFAYADALGAAGLAVFSVREGKECFEKAISEKMCTCH